MKVGLISCTKTKLSNRAAARELYSASSNFRKRVAYVEDSCDTWFVLSAKHHLVAPDDELDPYEKTLDGEPVAIKRRWSVVVLTELGERLGKLSDHEFEIHAGRNYYDFGLAKGLRQAGAVVEIPAEGLNMYELSSFYGSSTTTSAPTRSGGRRMASSYEPLRAHLEHATGDRIDLSFSEIETILGRSLPASARKYREWWANHVGTHSHARAWVETDWKVDQVNLTAERVTFRRNG